MTKGLSICAAGVGLLAFAVARPWSSGPEPEPFEYDSGKNQYWHAEQGQWLEGRPPFHPFEYDSTRDRYFHPGDGDWRPGRPPAP
jgi:hypothetical protein